MAARDRHQPAAPNIIEYKPKPVISKFQAFSHFHHLIAYSIMTRSNKANDRNHAGLADGTAVAEDRLPRYFAKSGHVDADPTSIKKHGGGRGNWGKEGEEAQDYGYNFANARRRSNSSTQALGDFKTKFEAMDADPVFEEELHGPTEEDIEKASMASMDKEESTDSSTLGGSVDGEESVGNKKL